MNVEYIPGVDGARREFLEIITQVRMHLEYQRALGVQSIETSVPSSGSLEPAPISAPVVSYDSPDSAEGKSVETTHSGLPGVCEELGNCTRCKLHQTRTNIVFGEGNPEAVLVFVGEGPGFEEDKQGRPFVGAAGQLLTDIIVKGMKLAREDVYICNIVKCRPPNNRNPELDEIEACEPFLIKQLEAIKPKVIVALGNIAAKTLLKTGKGITALRGTWQTYQGIPLMPTFHPAYLLRNPRDKALVWKDIQQVMAELEKPGKDREG
jgi:uracil-DNA glycosylase family 4